MILDIINGSVKRLEDRLYEVNKRIEHKDYGKEILLLKLKNRRWKREDGYHTIGRLQKARDSYYFSENNYNLGIEDIMDGKGKEYFLKDKLNSVYEKVDEVNGYSLSDIDSMKYVLARIAGNDHLQKRKKKDKELRRIVSKVEDRLYSKILKAERKYRWNRVFSRGKEFFKDYIRRPMYSFGYG